MSKDKTLYQSTKGGGKSRLAEMRQRGKDQLSEADKRQIADEAKARRS